MASITKGFTKAVNTIKKDVAKGYRTAHHKGVENIGGPVDRGFMAAVDMGEKGIGKVVGKAQSAKATATKDAKKGYAAAQTKLNVLSGGKVYAASAPPTAANIEINRNNAIALARSGNYGAAIAPLVTMYNMMEANGTANERDLNNTANWIASYYNYTGNRSAGDHWRDVRNSHKLGSTFYVGKPELNDSPALRKSKEEFKFEAYNDGTVPDGLKAWPIFIGDAGIRNSR